MALEIIVRCSKITKKVLENKEEEDKEVIKKLLEVIQVSFNTLFQPRAKPLDEKTLNFLKESLL